MYLTICDERSARLLQFQGKRKSGSILRLRRESFW